MGLIQITLARPKSGARWSATIVLDQDRVIWTSPETFDSADKAYYRAIGEVILRNWDSEVADSGDAIQQKHQFKAKARSLQDS